MNRVLIAASAFALCIGAAFAGDDDTMGGFYGNTIISTGGMAEIHTHYAANHTFDLTGTMMGMTKSFKGTWALDGKGNVCRTYEGELPPNATNPQCVPVSARKVGDTWTVTFNGATRTLSVKAGTQ